MPRNQRRPYLLAYDIADPKRLVRVHRRVRNHGLPLQYSVFLVVGTTHDLDRLLAELDDIIQPNEDDIRVYPLPLTFDAHAYGRQWLPAGVDVPHDASMAQALLAMVAEQDARAAAQGAASPGASRRRRKRRNGRA
ncbi:CRISPR-associated endonuclease Cas2 [uncultured Thiohalocapsa sp.]|uniref:CRISPR-associated endonuclease Cas2 n=1 Tax=uncultured Thiohalocapsa sp. TaxID=768990 RepID=UPI0025D6D816|nr:CRISPR-associated endonuclease Cas2 [uncultured Thiohalocapsa sp.]